MTIDFCVCGTRTPKFYDGKHSYSFYNSHIYAKFNVFRFQQGRIPFKNKLVFKRKWNHTFFLSEFLETPNSVQHEIDKNLTKSSSLTALIWTDRDTEIEAIWR